MANQARSHAYFHGLDVIRFAAAMAVAVYNLDAVAHGTGTTFWWGLVGVEIFFLLSGTVIANSAEGSTFRAFLVNRLLRLYPAAWACAAINFAFLLLRPSLEGLDLIKFFASMTLFAHFGQKLPAPIFIVIGFGLTLILSTVVALMAEPPMRRGLRSLLSGPPAAARPRQL